MDTMAHGTHTTADHTRCSGSSLKSQINNSIPIQRRGTRIYTYKATARMDEDTLRTKKVSSKIIAVISVVIGSASFVSHMLLLVKSESIYR